MIILIAHLIAHLLRNWCKNSEGNLQIAQYAQYCYPPKGGYNKYRALLRTLNLLLNCPLRYCAFQNGAAFGMMFPINKMFADMRKALPAQLIKTDVGAAAKYYGVSEETVRHWIRIIVDLKP